MIVVTMSMLSAARRQAFIDAPVPIVWELVSDVNRHPEWWPRVIEVECDGLEEGCTYREVVKVPLGKDEMHLHVDALEEGRNLSIRCLNTGSFVRFLLTEAQGGTFADVEIGMEPQGLRYRVFDATAGKRYFASWLGQTMEALDAVACKRAREGSAA
jgi:uncharacterized protein YndB with AHSA1/START domain